MNGPSGKKKAGSVWESSLGHERNAHHDNAGTSSKPLIPPSTVAPNASTLSNYSHSITSPSSQLSAQHLDFTQRGGSYPMTSGANNMSFSLMPYLSSSQGHLQPNPSDHNHVHVSPGVVSSQGYRGFQARQVPHVAAQYGDERRIPHTAPSSSGSTSSPRDGSIDPEELAIVEDKRQRNTAASARFRIKKKQRDLNLERAVSDLSSRAEELEREATDLRRENTWLKEIVIMKGRRNMANAVSTSTSNRGSRASQSKARAKDQSTSEDSETDNERRSRRKKKGKDKGKDKAAPPSEE